MDFPDSLLQQLQQLQQFQQVPQGSDPPEGTGEVGPGLPELLALVRQVQLVVPSLLAVCLVRTRLGVPVPLVLLTPETGSRLARASLAVALPSPAGSSALLVLQAADPGAFLLLADQLRSWPRAQPALAPPAPQLDQHLRLPAPDGMALAAALADLSLIDQATGMLIERGLLPAAAIAALRRRARLASTSLPDASRAVLAETAPPAGGTHHR